MGGPGGVSPGGFVIVSGPPASGKSTLAAAVATELDLPLLAKDVIKDALVDALGAPDLPRSRELGRAAVHVLLAVARTAGRGGLESVWHDRAREPLRALPGPAVVVFCRCAPQLRKARFLARSAAAGWPGVEVDTGTPVDVPALARRIRAG